ncbi:DNA binding domain protein [Mycobacterium phage Catdawg]|uniref:DNA binding domain protein n=1 Tax=Mycobacterium phage Catdawg TaxID=1340819 RepID=S5Y3L0_9CAUD|nr:HTH DNA binding protein [Mycobacterium phage Catdawg]ATW60569.1 helix-turn-helix DNA binding protein [Mycobacterium phage Familton]QGJ87408.1 helix-turn-helix DNA binding domain protein [Mycobacterium phage Blessica]QWY81572.1 helix-turn-helix DNA binding domain protein [Mycobacterium phage Winget]URM87857.1 helix-turn-helix DNA-binding domain protein [Mycobacterium phage Idergollasper]AGT12057.1 DNA binding domain protein [Mycobacterium phage Catdawg]
MARSKVVSIQAEPHRRVGGKSPSARNQARTLRKAHRQGLPWEDDEVARLAQGIAADETTLDIALAIGRSYYGVMSARSHVGFALRHWDALAAVQPTTAKKGER